MENLIFVGIVFAIGVILYALWKLIEAQRLARKFPLANGQPFPPNKRVDDGPDPVEEAKFEFQQRIDKWQRTQTPRWSGLRHSAEGLAGEKYRFEPQKRERRNVNAKKGTATVRQQFELVG